MPHKVKLYGSNDGLVQFDDSLSAHKAPAFYNNHNLRGHTITVRGMSVEKSEESILDLWENQ